MDCALWSRKGALYAQLEPREIDSFDLWPFGHQMCRPCSLLKAMVWAFSGFYAAGGTEAVLEQWKVGASRGVEAYL
jgi:hypothetical protein